jgi:hypothetical protein
MCFKGNNLGRPNILLIWRNIHTEPWKKVGSFQGTAQSRMPFHVGVFSLNTRTGKYTYIRPRFPRRLPGYWGSHYVFLIFYQLSLRFQLFQWIVGNQSTGIVRIPKLRLYQELSDMNTNFWSNKSFYFSDNALITRNILIF